MIEFILAVLLLLNTPSYDGGVAFYNPGLMQKVAIKRGMEVTECMAASVYADLGDTIVVVGKETLYCQVVDVTHPKHVKQIKRRNIVVELDYESGLKVCGTKKMVRPDECQVTVYISSS